MHLPPLAANILIIGIIGIQLLESSACFEPSGFGEGGDGIETGRGFLELTRRRTDSKPRVGFPSLFGFWVRSDLSHSLPLFLLDFYLRDFYLRAWANACWDGTLAAKTVPSGWVATYGR